MSKHSLTRLGYLFSLLVVAVALTACGGGTASTTDSPASGGDSTTDESTDRATGPSSAFSDVTAYELIFPDSMNYVDPSAQGSALTIQGTSTFSATDPFPVWSILALTEQFLNLEPLYVYRLDAVKFYEETLLQDERFEGLPTDEIFDINGDVVLFQRDESRNEIVMYLSQSDALWKAKVREADGADDSGWEVHIEIAHSDGIFEYSGFDSASGWAIEFQYDPCSTDGSCFETDDNDFFYIKGINESGTDLQLFYGAVTKLNFNGEDVLSTANYVAQGNDDLALIRYATRNFFEPAVMGVEGRYRDDIRELIAVTETVSGEEAGQLLFFREAVSSKTDIVLSDVDWDMQALALRKLSPSDAAASIQLSGTDVSGTDNLGNISDGVLVSTSSTDVVAGDLILNFGYGCGAADSTAEWSVTRESQLQCPLVSYEPDTMSPTDAGPPGLSFAEDVDFGEAYSFALSAASSLNQYEVRDAYPISNSDTLLTFNDADEYRAALALDRRSALIAEVTSALESNEANTDSSDEESVPSDTDADATVNETN